MYIRTYIKCVLHMIYIYLYMLIHLHKDKF